MWPWSRIRELEKENFHIRQNVDTRRAQQMQASTRYKELAHGHDQLVIVAKGRKKKLRELGVDVRELDKDSLKLSATFEDRSSSEIAEGAETITRNKLMNTDANRKLADLTGKEE